MPTRPGDWSALGLSGDPVPGDPAMLNTIADTMRDLATSAGVINTGLRELQTTAGDGQRFIGVTADRLREMVDSHLYNFVGHVEESFRKAENAIRVYATAVETAQARPTRRSPPPRGCPRTIRSGSRSPSAPRTPAPTCPTPRASCAGNSMTRAS
ncbi:hypothetical protein SAZ11_51315 [Streptomyces sp. FXJ1.4098]|nr:hypothetical protein [Streptomyces sp. FXJ1.4098]